MRRAQPDLETYACDYTDALMELRGQPVAVANLNEDPLPYPAAHFDLVTCTEVIEHLENYRRLLREVFRVLKPGGTLILSTPNVLNLQSRLRFFYFGFWNLFGPLPIGRAERFSTVGHITPVPYFYLAHALAESGFVLQGWETDKVQRSAIPKLLVALPFIWFFGWRARRREAQRYRTVDAANVAIVRDLNRVSMLLGRTLLTVARRPGPG